MKSQKYETIAHTVTANPRETLAHYLSVLIPRQVEMGSEAVQCGDAALASLLACQIFDLLDWSRLHLDQATLAMLHDCILANLSASALRFTDLQQLEEYAETYLACAD